MKKIFIFSHGLNLGGAETALLGLLETLDTSRYEVDLFLMRHDGPLMPFIPKGIHLLPEMPQYASLAVPLKEVLRQRQLGVAWGRLVGKVKAKRRLKRLGITGENGVGLEYSHKYTLRWMPAPSTKEYDLAISFLTPHYFVARKVKARKKIAWIHTDYNVVKVDVESETKMWDEYDAIASISKDVSQIFSQVFPTLKPKLRLIENILGPDYVAQRSRQFSVESEMPQDGSLRLLTVGEFSPAKGFDMIPEICRKLRAWGFPVKWYVIGYGTSRKTLNEEVIAKAGVEGYVVILGKRENPYPYFKACDVYVQPSRYEGKCVAVREAQMLGKPVIITHYPTAPSQLEDGVDGVIVPLEIDACAEGIAAVLRNPQKLRALSEACLQRDYSNRAEVEKIYALLEEP